MSLILRPNTLGRRQLVNHLTLNQATFATDVSTGFANNTNCTVSQDATPPAGVTGKGMIMTSTAASVNISIGTSPAASFQYRITAWPGLTYTALTSCRAVSAQTQQFRVDIVWFDNTATQLSATNGTAVLNSSSAWTQVSNTAVSPANTAFARIIYRVISTNTIGEQHEFAQGFFGQGTVRTWSSP